MTKTTNNRTEIEELRKIYIPYLGLDTDKERDLLDMAAEKGDLAAKAMRQNPDTPGEMITLLEGEAIKGDPLAKAVVGSAYLALKKDEQGKQYLSKNDPSSARDT